MENNSPAGSIYALVAVISWFSTTFLLNVGLGEIQVVISILGGLAAFVSGSISIFKHFQKPK